jgi:hypothetical protein
MESRFAMQYLFSNGSFSVVVVVVTVVHFFLKNGIAHWGKKSTTLDMKRQLRC